jgi:flagellin
MRELAVQGSNDTLTDTDRGAIASELTSLASEIDRISSNTEFNTKKLLNGSLSTALAGAGASDLVVGEILTASNVSVSAINVSGAAAGTTFTMTAAGTSGVTLTATIGGTTVSQTVAISAMTAVGSQTLNFNTLGVSVSLSGFDAAALQSTLIADLTNGANDTIVTAASSAAASFQVGANNLQTVSVSIDSSNSGAVNGGTRLNFGDAGTAGFTTLSAGVATFAGASTSSNAQKLILSLDDAISDVSANRATLGAVQNRLEHTIENLATQSENITASESRIRDADMAAEMVGFTRSNILQQAGTSILAQANQLPQGVLALLR